MSSADSISSRFSQLSPLKQALLALEDLQARLAASEQSRNEPIAIIGMGCRFPGANDTSSFWELLQAGRDVVTEVPESRWKIDDYYDPNPDATVETIPSCVRQGERVRYPPILAADYLKQRLDASKPEEATRG